VKPLDLTGQIFGKLTVVALEGINKRSQKYWVCRCACGNETSTRTDILRAGKSTSCGHCPNSIDQAGDVIIVWIESKGERFPCLIDANDYPLVRSIRWCVTNDPKGRTRYAQGAGNGPKMHSLILSGAKEVDHFNGNGLDNRRRNLRESTHKQNSRNKPKRRGACASFYKGVSKLGRKFAASINANDKRIFLGSYDTELDAARAYNEAATKYHKEFAVLNDLGDVSDVLIAGIFANGPLRGKPVSAQNDPDPPRDRSEK
jgi:hypothetical protein